ncbi:hypothetical protein Nepgr_000510 [Nepenthes gracilis]|uniref:Zinc finger CCCH domain-containing protein 13 n=1 Tax=Nepenthes gracilis TaxID=150966 RepID=A0AAD3RWI9_NEPGR|nr:hypothetical protein Nepgr_000510 [Nepenthes gracilis]
MMASGKEELRLGRVKRVDEASQPIHKSKMFSALVEQCQKTNAAFGRTVQQYRAGLYTPCHVSHPSLKENRISSCCYISVSLLMSEGHCGRQTCSFAHGEAELRRYSGSFNGRQANRSNDLRNRLDRRRSPLHKYSPVRDARGRHRLHGYSPPNTLGRRRKRQHVDGQSDFSGSLKASDGTEDEGKQKHASSESRGVLWEQLKQVKFDLDLLVDQKHQIEVELEGRGQEADNLSSRIQDLEAQLTDERENCKRIVSKIKKFIGAHNHYARLQDELKRSQVRVDKLVVDFSLDSSQPGAIEEDACNVLSDGETTVNHLSSRLTEKKENAYTAKKRFYLKKEAVEGSKSANLSKKGHVVGDQEASPWNTQHIQFNDNREADVVNKKKAIERPDFDKGKPKRPKDAFKGAISSDKVKGLESNLAMPPTGMAAHAADEFNELVETEEQTVMVETISTVVENGGAYEVAGLLLPPLPPVSQNNYLQYKGDDDDVDVDGLEEELMEVDIV